jgi:hypothetical protein
VIRATSPVGQKADAAFRDRILLAETAQAHLAAEPTEGAWIL